MTEPVALHLSQFFSALAGKPVSFAFAGNVLPSQGACMYGVYASPAEDGPVVMRIGLKALALLGASLLGLPEDTAMERATATPTDEPMRDAMHEVLNIASTAIGGETRLVFQQMFRELSALPTEAANLVRSQGLRTSFRVAVDGVGGDTATIFF